MSKLSRLCLVRLYNQERLPFEELPSQGAQFCRRQVVIVSAERLRYKGLAKSMRHEMIERSKK